MDPLKTLTKLAAETPYDKIKALAEERAFDGMVTDQVAALAGVSAPVALKALKKLHAEGFETSGGSTLSFNANVSENKNQNGPATGGRNRNQIFWFFM
jgi:hypothetical protein